MESGSNKNSSLLILHNALIVTMDTENRVFQSGAIVIEDDTIKAIGQSTGIISQFSSFSPQLIDFEGHFILPGFINTHVHSSQQLARGIADDVDLLTWLHNRIWPYESNMTEEDSYISTLLCGIELIHSGVTCFAEAGGQHVTGMARAVQLLGLRACLVESIMDAGEGLPGSWTKRTSEECIQSQKELYKKHHNTADGRIRVWFGIRQIMNSTDDLLNGTRDAAEELKTGIHMHVAEIPYENQHVMERRGVQGTVTYLEKVKLLQSNFLAAHTVWVNDEEVCVKISNESVIKSRVAEGILQGKIWEVQSTFPICRFPSSRKRKRVKKINYIDKQVSILAKAGVKVSHCPAAAMRMFGFAPVKKMLDAGVCVSLGTDGAPSNNRMSIVDEMYLASLINKGQEVFTKGTTDPTALRAETILKMVTINGAKSILWDKEIGSLEVGKKADIIVVNPSSWSMMPVHDCISSLVYSMRTENITSVMCNGRWIMRERRILSVDEKEVISMAKHASTHLLNKAGIQIPSRINIV